MSLQPQKELLSVLRASLRRIEAEHPDESDLSPDALDLKRLLLRRIDNIETAMKTLNDILEKHHRTDPGELLENKLGNISQQQSAACAARDSSGTILLAIKANVFN